MRLYGQICKVEPQSDGTVKVEGIASSEAIDDQGEIVRADAMRQAIPDEGRLPLTRNFRSQPEILKFVNALFERAIFRRSRRARACRQRSARSA